MSTFTYTPNSKCCLSKGIQHVKKLDYAVEWLDSIYETIGNMVRNITTNNGFAPKYSKLIPSTWIGLVSNVFLLNLSINLSIYLFIYVFIYLSICLSIHLSINLSIYLMTYLSILFLV